MKLFKRGQKGFTLVELMVVMAIMAVLATIVVPAVTGTKEVSESGQMKADASALRTGITNFQNESLTSSWPEVGAPQLINTANGTLLYNLVEVAKLPAGIAVGERSNDVTIATHTEIFWTAETLARQANDLAPQPLALTPDFVDKQPASVRSLRSADLHEYIWLLAIEAKGTDQETRVLQGYKLSEDSTAYEKIY